MVIRDSEETGRPINKGFDHDNDNIYEEAHVSFINYTKALPP